MNKIITVIILLVLAISVFVFYKPLQKETLSFLHKVGLAGEICSNAEVVGDIALPVYRCSYKLKTPLIRYCHIGWSGNHCHFFWEDKHIH